MISLDLMKSSEVRIAGDQPKYSNFSNSFLSGRPTPKVTWWRDHALLDDVSEVVDEVSGKVTNELRLVQLRRTDLHSILTCQASNNNISVPASTSVKLDMHCKFFFVGVVVIRKNNSTYFFPQQTLVPR